MGGRRTGDAKTMQGVAGTYTLYERNSRACAGTWIEGVPEDVLATALQMEQSLSSAEVLW